MQKDTMNTICIMCPMGCPISVSKGENGICVSGNTCPRGKAYGISEFTSPTRTLTTLVRKEDGGVASVKTTAPIPKAKLLEVVEFVKGLTVPVDAQIGDVVASGVLGLDADLIISGNPNR